MKTLLDVNCPNVKDMFEDTGGLYMIPAYQRPYLWAEEQIDKLLDDIIESLNEETGSIAFIGSIILSEDDEGKKIPVKRAPPVNLINIVDGQQRITTLLLIFIAIREKINNSWQEIKTSEKRDYLFIDLEDKIGQHSSYFQGILFKEVTEYYLEKKHSYFPKLINEGDIESAADGIYHSAIAQKIQEYNENKNEFDNKELDKQTKKDIQNLNSKIQHIDGKLEALVGRDIEMYCEKTKSDEYKEIYRNINSSGLDKILKEKLKKILVLLIIDEHIREDVRMVAIRITNKRYIFDVFESLNTTGIPLTAIDTLKPLIVKENDDGYGKSEDKAHFDRLDEYLGNNNKKREKNSKEVTLRFLQTVDGTFQSNKLRPQQDKLREYYKDSPDKHKYVEVISKVGEFLKNIWEQKNVQKIKGSGIRDETLLYMSFIRDTNTRLAIPILVPYWLRYNNDPNEENTKSLEEVCSAVASFIVLWRSFHSDTSNIDDALRSVMTGEKKNKRRTKIVSGYTGINYRDRSGIRFDKTLPSAEEIKEVLRSLLKEKGIAEKTAWIKKAKGIALYEVNKELCRYLILISHNKTEAKNGKLEIKDSQEPDYKRIDIYYNPKYDTLEHIAPRILQPGTDWYEKFYSADESLRHTIGNLTLMGLKENSLAGCRDWEDKKTIYHAISRNTKKETQEILDACNINIKPATKEQIKNKNECRIVRPLLEYEDWTPEEVEKRSENLLDLAWEDLAAGVGLKK